MKNDVNDFPPLSLTDYLVQDLYQFYKQFNNRLLLRLNLY